MRVNKSRLHVLLILTVIGVVFLLLHSSISIHTKELKFKVEYPRNGKTSYSKQGHSSSQKLAAENEIRVTITSDNFRNGAKTGNPLIDSYGENDQRLAGHMGTGIVLSNDLEGEAKKAEQLFHINTIVSDMVPLNRMVPDSRLPECADLSYNISTLPTVSVLIPFYDEWPSVLLRTVYSIINRSPRRLIKDIILIDDCSKLESVKEPLDKYIKDHFPQDLVKLIRMPERKGLSSARMKGAEVATGDVLVIFDSHMEVNVDWLPPLLTPIAKDSHVVAMALLDYIQWDTLKYKFDRFYTIKYGWDWSMTFFETFFRPDEIRAAKTDTRPGSTMVGAAFAINKAFFFHLGGYDTKMSIWGGENLEMTWRVSLCGGKLLHVPCSKIGHIARTQPYEFPGGRSRHEFYNWKRATSVWMGNLTRFVHAIHPSMKDVDVGDISERIALKERLKCKDFHWYITHVWPELHIYDEGVIVWGKVKNEASKKCLDNHGYLFQMREKILIQPCGVNTLRNQGFSLTKERLLRTSLQCVVAETGAVDSKVVLEDCIIGSKDTWKYEQGHLIHEKSKLCLFGTENDGPILRTCSQTEAAQKWTFEPFTFS